MAPPQPPAAPQPPQPPSAWQRFARNRLALAGLCMLGLLTLVCTFGYVITPDGTPNANRQLLEAARLGPGASVQALSVYRGRSAPETSWLQHWLFGSEDAFTPLVLSRGAALPPDSLVRLSGDTLWHRTPQGRWSAPRLLPELLLPIQRDHHATRTFLQTYGKPYRLMGDSIVWAETNPMAGDISQAKTSLTALRQQLYQQHLTTLTFPLGTDTFGRDLLSRLILGGRVSLAVGFLAVLLSIVLGIGVGAASGYFGGWTDAVAQWVMAVIWSLPSLLLAIALAFALGKGFLTLFIAVGLSLWVEPARILRGEVLSLRTRTWVDAARTLGFGSRHILLRELLPNLVGPIVILAAANFATAILLEAGLSFLGLGVNSPTPSWGGMIYEGYQYLVADAGKWMAIFPGLAIVVTIFSLHLVGQGLRDAFDPRLQR